MKTKMPNIIWKTPQEIDADRLRRDYAELGRGGFVSGPHCALGGLAIASQGTRTPRRGTWAT